MLPLPPPPSLSLSYNLIIFRFHGDSIIYCVLIGNRTFVGYVYTEITINNAVVRVFVKIMQDTVDHKKAPLPRGRGASLRLRSQCKTTTDYSSNACDDGEAHNNNNVRA